MNDQNPDRALGDTSAPEPEGGAIPAAQNGIGFHHTSPVQIDFAAQLTIEEILDMARLPERTAYLCLRADLQAKNDEIIEELGTLVTASGELIIDPEASIGEQTAASRAQQLADEQAANRRAMHAASTPFLFRGMSADDFAVFEKAHRPKSQDADFTEYFIRLIASCCVRPAMSEDQVRALRKKFGARAFLELSNTVQSVNTGGGVDIPKSLSFSQVRQGS